VKYPFQKKVSSEEETIQLATAFAEILAAGDVVVLNGNLGAGKTFFIKSVLKKYNIENVNSPTFAIVNEYKNDKSFYHFDFYRIIKRDELIDIGYFDYLNDPDSTVFIEWGNLHPDLLPAKRIEIDINLLNDTEREFNFKKYE
jgi:tRNA threonylcarbamoyladenosine biosynthesis protein TsaE